MTGDPSKKLPGTIAAAVLGALTAWWKRPIKIAWPPTLFPGQARDHGLEAARERLQNALAECCLEYSVPPEHVAELLERLTDPPASVRWEGLRRLGFVDAGGDPPWKAAFYTKDEMAALWGWEHGRPGVKWSELRRAEKQAARRFDAYLDSPGVYPQERPRQLDPALVLWLAFTLEEALERVPLPFSRPALGGPPGGPAFRALMAALACEHAKLDSIAIKLTEKGARPLPPQPQPPKPKAVASILEASRKPAFAAFLGEHGLERKADAVAEHPPAFRLAIGEARKDHPKHGLIGI